MNVLSDYIISMAWSHSNEFVSIFSICCIYSSGYHFQIITNRALVDCHYTDYKICVESICFEHLKGNSNHLFRNNFSVKLVLNESDHFQFDL